MPQIVTDPETEFEKELQVFDNDVDVAIQCIYTWLTVHAAARKNRKIYDLLNRNRGVLGFGFGFYSGQFFDRAGPRFRQRQTNRQCRTTSATGRRKRKHLFESQCEAAQEQGLGKREPFDR